MITQSGKVFLVGAGPGDPGLVTVRATELLRQCDAVVFDNLIPEELIALLPARVERHYVGKKAGDHALPQDDINALLVRLAKEDKQVVRLKGGDPLVFGRGGEEATYLREHDVPFEIVPGVTAGVAAPAYAGIPTTDRTKSSQVLFVTGHKSAVKETSSVDWEWVAKMAKGTLIVYMGVSELPNIAAKLIEGGMQPDTPVAAVERGTTSRQRTVSSTLEELPAAIKSEAIKPPTLFVVGDTVDLADNLTWFGQKPLSGQRVLVTRPSSQARWLYDRLHELGAEVLPYPTIAIEEAYDRAAWDRVKRTTADNQWLVFTSENGVKYFMSQWMTERKDVRLLANYKIAAVGTGTARALKEYHLPADFMPDKATTPELAKQMVQAVDLKGATVVRVRGNLGDTNVEDTLREAGAQVLPMPVYQTYNPIWPDYVMQRVLENPPDVIFFTSGSSVEGFVKNVSGEERQTVCKDALVLSIGPMTSKTIESHGMTVGLEVTEHSIPAMVDALAKHFTRSSQQSEASRQERSE